MGVSTVINNENRGELMVIKMVMEMVTEMVMKMVMVMATVMAMVMEMEIVVRWSDGGDMVTVMVTGGEGLVLLQQEGGESKGGRCFVHHERDEDQKLKLSMFR